MAFQLGLRIAMLEVLRLRPRSSILEPLWFGLGLLRRMMDDKDWLNTENFGQQRNWSWNCFYDSKIYRSIHSKKFYAIRHTVSAEVYVLDIANTLNESTFSKSTGEATKLGPAEAVAMSSILKKVASLLVSPVTTFC